MQVIKKKKLGFKPETRILSSAMIGEAEASGEAGGFGTVGEGGAQSNTTPFWLSVWLSVASVFGIEISMGKLILFNSGKGEIGDED